MDLVTTRARIPRGPRDGFPAAGLRHGFGHQATVDPSVRPGEEADRPGGGRRAAIRQPSRNRARHSGVGIMHDSRLPNHR